VTSKLLIFAPPFQCLPLGHSAACLGDPVNCRFTCWSPGYTSQLPLPLLCCKRRFRPGSSLFSSECVSLHVDIRYAETTQAMTLTAAILDSSTVSVWIRGEIMSEARLRSRSQSVWISTWAEMSLALI